MDGVAGPPGRSIDTALVNTNGHLLLGTNDGEVIDCGRVVGPVGTSGERGPAGLPGEPGRDGNTILSGAGAPDNELGKQGDWYIETGSENMPMYLKTDAGWRKQTELRHIIPSQAPSGASTPRNDTRAVPLHNAGVNVNGQPLYREVATSGLAKALPPGSGIQPGYDTMSRPIQGIFPDPGPCKNQENFNLWVMQCIHILGTFHAQYYIVDGTNADQTQAPDQEGNELIGGNAADNIQDSTIDGGSSMS